MYKKDARRIPVTDEAIQPVASPRSVALIEVPRVGTAQGLRLAEAMRFERSVTTDGALVVEGAIATVPVECFPTRWNTGARQKVMTQRITSPRSRAANPSLMAFRSIVRLISGSSKSSPSK